MLRAHRPALPLPLLPLLLAACADAPGLDPIDDDAPFEIGEPACDDGHGDTEEAFALTTDLPPQDPKCLDHTGPGTCWEEWLKEVGTVDFAPVGRGALGAGPWPVEKGRLLGSAEGLAGPVVGASVDTGQNQYAITSDALYVRRRGEARFTRYPRNTNGLRDYPFVSIAGAGPGVAYVGYAGIVTATEYDDPPEIARSGDIQRVELTAGGLRTHTYDTHNSNYYWNAKYDHVRYINDIVVPRRGPAAGEVYLASEHAVVRYQGDLYCDHRHLSVVLNGSQRFGAARALAVTDDGTMWYGSEYLFGALPWTPRLYEWYHANWQFPTNAFGGEGDKDAWEGIGVDSTGGVWAVGRGRGLAHLPMIRRGRAGPLETLAIPDADVRDLAVDLDDTIWLAAKTGLWHYEPAASRWTRLGEAGIRAVDVFLDDTVSPRALYAAMGAGVFVHRGIDAPAAPPEPEPAPTPTYTPPSGGSFADDFDACTSVVDLGSRWETRGRWDCAAGRARGETALGQAIAAFDPPEDVVVDARVVLTGSATGSGLLARATAGHAYAARMLTTGRVQLVRVDGAVVTVLAEAPAPIAAGTSARVTLAVVGTSPVRLSLRLDGRELATAADGSAARLATGRVGLLSGSGARTQFDGFNAN